MQGIVILFIFCLISPILCNLTEKYCVENLIQAFRSMCYMGLDKRRRVEPWKYFESLDPVPPEGDGDSSEMDFYNEIMGDLGVVRPEENDLGGVMAQGPLYLTSEIIPDPGLKDYYQPGMLGEILGLRRRRKRSPAKDIYRILSRKCCAQSRCTDEDLANIDRRYEFCSVIAAQF